MNADEGPQSWDDSYAGETRPWDIGRPQTAFMRLTEAGALAGAVLDAGCGTGEHPILAARHKASAYGIDVSHRAIQIVRGKPAERGANARFEVLEALRVDTLAQIFDTVADGWRFHVFDDDARARYVAAIHAVLRPGGHLHVICFSDHQPGDWGPRRVSEHEWHTAFGSGWRIDSLARDRFYINPRLGTATAEAWLADIVRLAPG